MRTRLAVAAVAAAATLVPAAASAAPAGHGHGHHKAPQSFTFGVIGDTPYGAEKIARFPQDVDRLNADTDLQALVHVGDIKTGSSPCTDEYNAWVKGQFDRLTMPLVYTPGDNEWTDCHRPAAGGYNALERLAAIRNTFFANPGTTLGAPVKLTSQINRGVPENVRGVQGPFAFASLHVVGSNDGLAAWTGQTKATTAQVADEKARMNAAIENVRATFREARRTHRKSVVLFQQADMFDGTYAGWTLESNSAFLPLVKTIAAESNRFEGDTYLFDGDSHVANDDRPLAAGSVWLTRYGLSTPAPKVRRITVAGAENADEYLKVTVTQGRRGAADTLTYRHVPLAS